MMMGEARNRNGRIYPRSLLETAVEEFNMRQGAQMGELEHPDVLTINLERVSHIVEKLWMEGDNVMGILKVTNTPCGNILKGLVESGVDICVSSRGGGNVVSEAGIDKVTEFSFVTMDAVGSPSAPMAITAAMTESLENTQDAFQESLKSDDAQAKLKELLVSSIVEGLK